MSHLSASSKVDGEVNDQNRDLQHPAHRGVISSNMVISVVTGVSSPTRMYRSISDRKYELIIRDQQDRIWNKAFVSVFIVSVLMNMSQQMVNTLIARYTNYLGSSSVMVGLVVSIFAYTALAFKFIAAPAIDAFSRKCILACSSLVVAASYFGIAFSANVPSLLASRLVQGAGLAFTTTTCLVLATDALPIERMGTGIGYYSLAQAACMAIGPSVGLYLSDMIGYPGTFMIGGGLMICAATAALRVGVTPSIRKPFRLAPGNMFAVEAFIPAIILMLLMLSYCNINSFLVLYADDIGVGSQIGWFFTVYALTMLASRPLVGRLSDRYGIRKVLMPALVCFALAFIIIGSATSLWLFLIAAFVSAFGFGAAGPALQALCMKCVPPGRRGAGSSTIFIGFDIGNIAGPVIAGAVIGSVGYSQMWFIMLVPVFISMAMVLVLGGRIDRLDAGNRS